LWPLLDTTGVTQISRRELPYKHSDLYNPLTMPVNLTKAHAEIDRAVDACYRAKAFDSDRKRVEFLFALDEKLTGPLTAGLKEPKRRRGTNRT